MPQSKLIGDIILKKIIAILALFVFVSFVASCSKCTASSGCSASYTASATAINDNTVLSTDLKKLACDALTSIQTLGGSSCTIKWQ